MNTPLLQVSDLHAGYGKAEVLRGLSLEVGERGVATVIGPNGAGKSTLLNALMGLLPMRGTVLFDGHDLSRLTLEERVMAGIALVPEKRELFATMTVEDNLVLGGWRPRSLGDPNWRREIDSVYARFPRLAERHGQQAGTLSGGERQMLAIGRALMGRPKLLMLDEPSLGLAPLIVKDALLPEGDVALPGVRIPDQLRNRLLGHQAAEWRNGDEIGAIAEYRGVGHQGGTVPAGSLVRDVAEALLEAEIEAE